jgi:two-component system NarL family response regulator
MSGVGLGAEPVRVVIADDHSVYRSGLHRGLEADPTIAVVAEAGDGQEAIARVEELVPDVVLMDVRMPRLNGIDAARAIRSRVPKVRVVMLTVSEDEDDLFEAIKAGANGYLLKELPPDEVADAIHAAANGDSLITPSMASKLLREFNLLATRTAGPGRPARDARPPAGPADPADPAGPAEGTRGAAEPGLTPRELEVLTLVAEGLSNRSVADQLYISENTVKNHMGNILEKLQLHSRTEAVMYAVRRGLFDPHRSSPDQTGPHRTDATR